MGLRVLYLHFAQKVVASIKVPLLGSDGELKNSRVLWAYIDPTFAEEQREIYQHTRIHRSSGLVKRHGNNGPFTPLYVAIFLAIAQHGQTVRQFYGGGANNQTQRVRSFNI